MDDPPSFMGARITSTKSGVSARGIVKLLEMIWSPGNSRHFPDAISTDPTLRPPVGYP
jgi:hypothetical protein